MDISNKKHYKFMLELCKHVNHKLNYGIKILSSKSLHWKLKCYSDYDFEVDIGNRK